MGKIFISPRHTPNFEKRTTAGAGVIQNFTPSWFSVNMGTGIVSISSPIPSPPPAPPHHQIHQLHHLHSQRPLLRRHLLRHIPYPVVFKLMIEHPVQSLFLGTAPMGFATIVNVFPWFVRAAGVTGRRIWLGKCGGLAFMM